MTDQTPQPVGPAAETSASGVSRRRLFRAAGAGAAVVGGGSFLAACSSGIKGASSSSSSSTAGSSASSAPTTKSLTIGWIHPLTGPLAGFGAPDNWVLSEIAQAD